MDTTPTASIPVRKHRKVWIWIAVLLIVAIGFIAYRQYVELQKSKEQKMVDEVAQASAKVNLTDAQKTQIVNDIKEEPAVKLSPAEAAKREAEIMIQINSQKQ